MDENKIVNTDKCAPPIEEQFMLLLQRYFTPCAIVLVLTGIIFAQLENNIKIVSASLLVSSVLFNIISLQIVKRVPHITLIVGNLRVIINYLFNASFIYFLGGAWGPIWLLLTLSPVATAVYSTTRKTIITAMIVSLTLGIIFYIRGVRAPIAWAHISVQMGFIFFISLFVHAMARLARECHPHLLSNDQG